MPNAPLTNAEYRTLINIIKKVRPNWPTPVKFIGKGAFGMVYNTNNGRVMKIAHGNATNEFRILREMRGMHFVPATRNGNMIIFNKNNNKAIKAIIKGFGGGPASAFIMNKVGGSNGMTLKNYLNKYPNANINRITQRVINIVKNFGIKGFSHGNLHSDNIIVAADSLGRITGMWLIDLGMTKKLAQRQINELTPLQIEMMLERRIQPFGFEVMKRRTNIAANLSRLTPSQNLRRFGRVRSLNRSFVK